MTGISPPFTEAVDWASASIAARGPLTVQGADLLCGTAEVLHRGGHQEITVDLHEVVLADTAALDLLRALAEELRARHGRLVVLTEEEEERQ
jgi:anti-anti-sigma regulatory factor